MKKFLILTVLMFLCSAAFTAERQSPISMNRDNYIIAGDKEDQTKFQLSIKGDIIYPFNTGLYLGYTQTTWWEVYDGADTMSVNYQPEVFYKLESKNNLFGDVDLRAIDFIQISPINHISNGVEGNKHRGMNLYYGQIQMSTGGRVSAGFNLKGFNYYSKSNRNKDIEKFKGYYENDLFLKLNSATVENMTLAEVHFKHGGTREHWWICGEAKTVLFTNSVQPRLFIQYYYGYGENVLFYNTKEHSVYAGLVF